MRLATASAAMEGVPMCPEAQRIMALWAKGQLTDDELVAAGREVAHQMASVSIRRGFQLPTTPVPIIAPSMMSVSRENPRHMTVLPGGGSLARAR
jgi:hypothetical protein